jgi:hypothetical protein
MMSVQSVGNVTCKCVTHELTQERRMEICKLTKSDAVKMPQMVERAPACDDGFVCAEDLTSDEERAAWGLVQAGLLLAEQMATVKSDVDGERLPIWGFALTSEGAGLLALLSALRAPAQDAQGGGE